MTSNIVLYWILWTVCRHLKSSGIILAFSTQHEAYLSCIIAAFLRPTNSLYVCWNSKKIINIALSLQYECMYLRSKKRLGRAIFLILKRSYGLDTYFFYNRVVSCLIWIGCDRSWEGAQTGAPAELITTSASVLFEVNVALESSFCRVLNQAIDLHLFLQIIYDIWAFQRKVSKYKQQCFLPSYTIYYIHIT